MDRSDTAKCLIDRSAEAGVADDSGMTALVMMISKMPSVVGGVNLSIKLNDSILSIAKTHYGDDGLRRNDVIVKIAGYAGKGAKNLPTKSSDFS